MQSPTNAGGGSSEGWAGGTWIEFPVSTRGSAPVLSTLQMVECFSLCISSHPLPFQINTLVNFNINLKQATKGFPRLPYTRVPGSEFQVHFQSSFLIMSTLGGNR